MRKRGHGRPTTARKVALKPDWERPATIRTSLYLAEGVYDALRSIAFEEHRKMHDIVIEGIGLALHNRGYPSLEVLKSRMRK